RVEHLLNRIEANLVGDTQMQSRVALEAMLEMVIVIDTPDLRWKMIKELTQHATSLSQFEHQDHVDHNRLQSTLVELDQLVDSFYSLPDAIGQQLRSNPFLNTIRQHMANPGGACPFGTPAYFLWLHQPVNVRNQHLLSWFSAF